MKFALVEGERREAKPGLSGKCPGCGNAMTAKCGERRIRVWHWAHWRTRDCDRWSEPETEWHRAWKNQFPEDWQETIHQSQVDGEKHIADVKTKSGLVLEFQYSFLRRDERESREMFYRNMVWVVYGPRRKRDRKQFFACLKARAVVNGELRELLWKEGALLRDWGVSRVPVYFDFGDSEPEDGLHFDAPTLWRLNPCGPNGKAYLSAVPKTLFVHAHLNGEPFEEMASAAVKRAAARYVMQQAPRFQPPTGFGFQRWLAREERKRRRF
jgi:hypothetical protein